ncbi:MAG TPA: alpha/beta hydrolase [Xanthobacteraceae bacterium]|nr:alpha/beta hydrolase [Xanthobacteraceae bacterium]
MTSLKWLLLFAVAGYAALVALLYLTQRSLMYFPDPRRLTPAEAGLRHAEEVMLQSADGVRVSVWHVPPGESMPVVIYFQGNGGGLNLRAERFRKLTADGTGLVALNYRGYGGSDGKPSEAGIILDAKAAYDFAAERYGADRIVLWGESLGTGVAVALAASSPVARIILESPYSSIADVAASIYWFVPVRLLLMDSFRSDQRIDKVTVPVLVVHGERDNVVRITFGERLYEMIPGPKQFIRLPKAGHNDHDSHGLPEMVRPFVHGREN